jgi:hypothetical protein
MRRMVKGAGEPQGRPLRLAALATSPVMTGEELRSGALVGIGVERADDAGAARPRCPERVAAVAVAREAAFLAQPIEGDGDLAPVIAADSCDDIRVEFRDRISWTRANDQKAEGGHVSVCGTPDPASAPATRCRARRLAY